MSHGIAFPHMLCCYTMISCCYIRFDPFCYTRALVRPVQAPTSHMLHTMYTTSHATAYKCKGSHLSAFRPIASIWIPSACEFGCIRQFVHLLFMFGWSIRCLFMHSICTNRRIMTPDLLACKKLVLLAVHLFTTHDGTHAN